MIDVKIKDSDIRKAVEEGMDSFVQVFVDAIGNACSRKIMSTCLTPIGLEKGNRDSWLFS